MGIDSYLQRDCAPQETLGSAFLDAMVFRRNTSLFFTSHVTVDGQRVSVALPDAGLPLQTTFGDGQVKTVVVTRAMAEQAAARLQPLESHCAGCPLNVGGGPFGCYGFLDYPIAAAEERWFMDVAASMSTAGAIAANLLGRVGVTGARVAALRARRGVFFESPVATTVEWLPAGEQQPLRLSSDALLELVFFRLGTPRREPLSRTQRQPLEVIASTLLGWWTPDEALAWLRVGTGPRPDVVLRTAPSQVLGDALARLAVALRYGVALVSEG